MPTSACPTSRQLKCLVSGDSTPDDVERLAEHLEACPRCVQTVETLHMDDTLVEAMRSQSMLADEPDPSVSGLIQRLRALRPQAVPPTRERFDGTQAVGSPLIDTATPRAAKTKVKLESILRPVEGPGELGRLGGYRVLKVLGMGGMGVVFQAEDLQLKRQVALKAMKRGTGSSPSQRKRFLREAQAAAALEHDHIVSIYQVGEDNGVLYLAMPLLQGESLEARLRRCGPLPVADVLRIGREIAEGLAAAHGRGLIHRDIKPANVWLEGSRARVKVLDFGLARVTDDNTQLTRPGAVVGTPAFIAPEQAGGQAVDPRADLFSLGCVLYVMATGSQPFAGESVIAILKAIAVDQPRPPADVNPAVPRALSDLVMRLLAKDPAARPSSAAEVIATLVSQEGSLTELAASTMRPDMSTLDAGARGAVAVAGPVRRRRWWPMVVAATFVVCLLGAAALGLLPGTNRDDDRPDLPLAGLTTDGKGDGQSGAASDQGQATNQGQPTPPGEDSAAAAGASETSPSGGAAPAPDESSAPEAVAQVSIGPSPADGFAVVEKYCLKCHGSVDPKGGLRLDTAAGLAAGGDSFEQVLREGDLDQSPLWTRVAVAHDMPPEEEEVRPTREEIEAFRAWLLAEARYPPDPGAAPELAHQAATVLKRHCVICHGQTQRTPGLDVRHVTTITTALAGKTKPFVVSGRPDQSLLWKKVVQNGSMPPKERPRLSDYEKEILTQWIEAGAPAYDPPVGARPFVDEIAVQQAILAHLRETPQEARRQQRYFTLTHLHNDRNIPDEDLPLFKAALSKALNSLSWQRDIVVPRPIDEQETVFAINLSDLGWTERKHWNFVLAGVKVDDVTLDAYPYALFFDSTQELVDLASEIQAIAGNSLQRLRVRADWFVAKATRPPLYHTLLELPETAQALEAQLKVDVVQDWQDDVLRRGAVLQSKVSAQNRGLDRHSALHGAYWKSFDFLRNKPAGNLLTHPLGPVFDENPFNEGQAFVQDGGELIFNLPNGLQAYLLVNGTGQRIDKGPIDVVDDPNKTSGSPEIVTGLSCMACHKNGTIPFQDDVRSAQSVAGNARLKVMTLFAPHQEMNDLLAKDENQFLAALLAAVKPFLPVQTVDEVRDYPEEPIGVFARRYHGDPDLEAIACELGFDDPAKLRLTIEVNPAVQAILGPLVNGGVVKRADWDSKANTSNSPFQEAASKLGRGVPVDLR